VGELLAWIYLHPETAYSVTDLANQFKVSQSTISREADQLARSGLVAEERKGNLRMLRADLNHLLARPLTELLVLTYGPVAVLTDLLPPARRGGRGVRVRIVGGALRR